jgi:hypothetical protein
MPSAIVKTLYFDLDKLAWTLTAGGNALLQPLTIGQNDTIDFNVQFIKGGVAQTLTAPAWSAGIKILNGFSNSYVVQFGAPTGTPPTYTFTGTISSTELSAALLTGVQFALEFRDSTNGIVTLPALTLNIAASYTITGTTPTSANGTLNVAAGKTVTFPLTLTFPSAAGTNGYKLTTDGATTLSWTADNAGTGDVVGPASATDNAIVRFDGTTGKLVQNSAATIADTSGDITAGKYNGNTVTTGTGTLTLGTGSITISANSPINTGGGTGYINTVGGSGYINTSSELGFNGGHINTQGGTTAVGGYIRTHAGVLGTGVGAAGGNIDTSNGGGSIRTDYGGGSIDTRSVGQIELGVTGTRTTFYGSASGGDKFIALPNATGTIALNETISGGTLAGSFTTLAASGVTSVTDTTNATSTTAASLKTAGGLGVVKTAWLGADIRFATNGAGGAGNIFLGTTTSRAGNGATTTGAQNVCIGSYPGQNLTSGQSNVLIGDQAGASLTTGSYNMSIGYAALSSAGAGSDYNVAIGASSLLNVTNGDNNVGIGRNAGNTVTTGGNNTFIGYDSDGVAGLSNQTAIGVNAICTAANQVMLGTASEAVVVPGTLAVGGGTVVAKLRHGNATLVSGTVTVTDTAITANSRIWINRFTDGGTLGDSYSITRSAGASFTITSKTANVTASLDTSVVTYFIIEP